MGSGPIGFSNDFLVISNNFVVTNNLMNLAEYGVSGSSGSLTVAGKTFTVTQEGLSCSYSISRLLIPWVPRVEPDR
jgi:hypothetical protein